MAGRGAPQGSVTLTQACWSLEAGTGGAVAQLGEHRLCKPGVAGSIPVRSTKEAGKFRRSRELIDRAR
jgi:hypothetical protein